MVTKSTIFKTVRMTVLLALLGGALVLFLLNRNIDPRFYRFLQSDRGRTIAQIMGWSVEFELAPTDIPETSMTEEEIEVKRELEALTRKGRPTHKLILKSGQKLTGRLVEITANHVKFLESYGDGGAMAASIGLERVEDVLPIEDALPKIFYRDVLLRMEFPDLAFYRRPPYTVVTDENFFRVEASIQVMRRLYRDFHATFESLITNPERGEGIQLIFFNEEERYKKYADKYAPLLEHTSGFYSPKLDRLTVFNQITSDQLSDAKREMKRKERLYRKQAKTGDEADQLKLWRSDAERSILRYAEEQTRYTLRHEGTHQLLFTYGVHSTHHAENTWIIEGIPVYCEGAKFGEIHQLRLADLKARQAKAKLIPLDELVNSRSARGLFVFGSDARVSLAYSESWMLVHFLMQAKYRNDFFTYIRTIRDPDQLDRIVKFRRVDLLAEFVGMTAEELDRKWQIYLQRM